MGAGEDEESFFFLTIEKLVCGTCWNFECAIVRRNCVASKYLMLSRTWSAAKMFMVIMSSSARNWRFITATRGNQRSKKKSWTCLKHNAISVFCFFFLKSCCMDILQFSAQSGPVLIIWRPLNERKHWSEFYWKISPPLTGQPVPRMLDLLAHAIIIIAVSRFGCTSCMLCSSTTTTTTTMGDFLFAVKSWAFPVTIHCLFTVTQIWSLLRCHVSNKSNKSEMFKGTEKKTLFIKGQTLSSSN